VQRVQFVCGGVIGICLLFLIGCTSLQPRDTCYVASPGLPELVYSGYKPHANSWDDFPPIKDLLDMVRMLESIVDFKVLVYFDDI
jgi:hypothetical protein